MADRTMTILGGGIGSLVAARRLRRSIDPADRVVLIDRDPTFRFASSYLWVMTGARPHRCRMSHGRHSRRSNRYQATGSPGGQASGDLSRWWAGALR